jgi:4-hydroxy-tetrahydrodipicolinate synthase
MATASEARAWARGALRGIGDSLYTPFCGRDGDDIDWEAYRTLVRYCVGELGHPMLWCTSGLSEFWSLTLDERKRLLEVAIEEGRAANPDVVVQACTAAITAKDCLDLTLHAQGAGADIAYIQTPMME